MITKAYKVEPDINLGIKMVSIDLSEVLVYERALLSIDGSTNITGVSIIGIETGRPLFSLAFCRGNETHVEYKVELKRKLLEILEVNIGLSLTYYEEPFIGYKVATERLLMLRTSVQELIAENKPRLDRIVYNEINNQKWKKDFLRPNKIPEGTEAQKKAIRDRVLGVWPGFKDQEQDEFDALGMGMTALMWYRKGIDATAKHKYPKFEYEVSFIGADDDESALAEVVVDYEKIKVPIQNGISMVDLDGKIDFDQSVYNNMGEEDKLLILKFRSKDYANIQLRNRVGNLGFQFDYLYASVVRTRRKKKKA